MYSYATPSRISHPGFLIQQQQQKEGGKEFVALPFFRSYKFHKIKNPPIFEQVRKKIEPIDKEFKYFLLKKCH